MYALCVKCCFFCVLLVICVSSLLAQKPHSCKEANLCCQVKNHTCFAFGPRMDEDYSKTECFCDQGCRELNDCCVDYETTCEAVDCEVSEWSDWGECNNPCGIGSQERRRKVIHPSQNGGRHCPVLLQKRVCVGEDSCHEIQSVEYQGEELREVGQVLPASFGIWRTSKLYDPLTDIRKNLFYDLRNEILKTPTYCAEYLITRSRKSCNVTSDELKWANALKKGNKICVECQPFAMDKERGFRCVGHGVADELTKWHAMEVPHCHGEWVMLTKHKPCTCNPSGDRDFIFV